MVKISGGVRFGKAAQLPAPWPALSFHDKCIYESKAEDLLSVCLPLTTTSPEDYDYDDDYDNYDYDYDYDNYDYDYDADQPRGDPPLLSSIWK